MSKDKEKITLSKYLLIKNLLEKKDNKKVFSYYDTLLITKKFTDIRELSITENILNLDTINLTPQDIIGIVDNFIKKANSPTFLKKGNLYELIKVSNLKCQKINKNISEKTFMALGKKLTFISQKTKLISFDFVILRTLDNFIIKTNKPSVKNYYNALKKDLLRKMITFSYQKEEREKQVTYFCWIDRVLSAVLNGEISLYEFMELNIKILKVIPNHLDACWKVLQTTNFLCFQPNYNDSNRLRKFKRDISKIIRNSYNTKSFNSDDVVELMISTLARENPYKEDFYYLFDAIKKLSQQSEKDKIFCFNLCDYILSVNERQNIFCYRFIREYFMNILDEMIKSDDVLEIKEKEAILLISLFHEKSFFFLHRSDILKKLIEIIRFFNTEGIQKNKFYKYCDMLDYILFNNPDIKTPEIIKTLSVNNGDTSKIMKRFDLSKSNFLV